MKRIPYSRQTIEKDDISAVAKTLKQDFLTNGPVTLEFERKIARKFGARFCVLCSSATAALTLSYRVIGIKNGSKVLIPSVTFCSTSNAAELLGAKVEHIDCNSKNGLLDFSYLEKILKKKKFDYIVPVHLGGQTVNMKKIKKYSQEFNLKVIEDASHAMGTSHIIKNERFVGDCKNSEMCIFSFHPVKNITMGEGGAITTNNEEHYYNLLKYRNHGIERNENNFLFKNNSITHNLKNLWYYEVQNIGFNFRISEINCALGLSQFKKLKSFKKKKLKIRDYYLKKLKDLDFMNVVEQQDTNELPCWHLLQILIDFRSKSFSKADLMHYLKKNRIETQVHYIPLHLQPYYKKKYGLKKLPNSEKFYEDVLSIPFFSSLQINEIDYVIDKLKSFKNNVVGL